MPFTLLTHTRIPELNAEARLYRHEPTGAQLLSIHTDDENKVFGITFRTPPPDSTGLPHIMEHSVLCGSRKYPVKEPFVELMKGSLNTFLNAFTYPDRTCYPVASQNLQDFRNLVDVYLDAVFHPLIPETTLQQEGWHYEVTPEGGLTYKGVVFNEMKGAYSSPDSLLGERSQQTLFPDTPYGVDSGGDPEHIPDLTYAQFKRFHETYYHPSNAYIYFYGDGPEEEERLAMVEAYLSEFDPRPVDSAIPLQEPFPEPRRVRVPYESDTPRGYIAVNFLLPPQGDPETALALSLLDHALMGTPASPLRRALTESGLGEDVLGGLSSELRQMYYTVGFKGIEIENAEKAESLILETLRRLAEEGIDPAEVAAALNTVEFALREKNTGSFPRGLALMLGALTFWIYGHDPLAILAFQRPLQAVKEHLRQEENYLEGLIRRHFLENPHRVTVVLEPDPQAGARRAARERERLERVRAALTPADLQRIAEQSETLRRLQETPDPPEALATIPTLKLEDLPREIRRIPTEVIPAGERTLLYHDLFTNGIVYFDLGFDLHTLPAEDLPYIPLFGRALTEMGTRKEDYIRFLQRIGQTTGGVFVDRLLSVRRGDPQGEAWFFLRGKATVEHAADLLSIFRDLLFDLNLDNRERFLHMALEAKARLESALAPAGHQFASRRLSAHLHTAGWAGEQMSGLDALAFLRGLTEQIQRDWPAMLGRLEGIRERLLGQGAAIANLTLDAENWRVLRPRVEDFLGGIPASRPKRVRWEGKRYPSGEGLGIPAQVHYVGKGASLSSLGFEPRGTFSVIRHYLNGTYLWEKVRVQGGAYGGFCVFNRLSGVWAFISYRDPNLLPTLEVYDRAADFLRSLDLSAAELSKAIIGVVGDLDAYQLPDAKGFTALQRYLLGITEEERQRWRDEVLDTTPQDFRAFADALQAVAKHGEVVALGPAERVEAAARARGWQYARVL